jgi:protein SCO1/2
MGKGVKPLLFSLSLFFFFLYASGWDPLEPGYQPSLPTVIKYGCVNITLPKAVLYDQYGEAVEFPPRGVYIVSFGYTYCPDVCPLIFTVLNATWRLSELPIYVVSVDPERDTPNRLRAFAEGGRYPFTFLTGREAERVWRAAGVYVARGKSGSGYVVYHDVLFLLVADGTARGYVAGLPDPASLLERLLACLEK